MQFLHNGAENFILIRKLKLVLFFDPFATNPNGKFSYFSGRIEFDVDPGFILYESRHTGSKKSIMESDFTKAYRYLFQWLTLPFF